MAQRVVELLFANVLVFLLCYAFVWIWIKIGEHFKNKYNYGTTNSNARSN